MPIVGNKTQPSVTTDGKELRPLIEGVVVRDAVVHMDDRGTLTEVYDPRWGINADPLVYVYKVTIRPGRVKGWSQHHKQDDRLFFGHGAAKIVLYDDRADSPTYKMINEIYLGQEHPGFVIIPKFVFHAVENVGDNEVIFVSMPTQQYNHADPDRFRLPLDTDKIPYTFKGVQGW